MSVPVAKKYTGQSKGINTEAALTEWPEGFVTDSCNFDLLPDGSYKKRPGLKQEENSSSIQAPLEAFSSYMWEARSTFGLKRFFVSQIATIVRIFTLDDTATIWDGSKLVLSLDLTANKAPTIPDNDVGRERVQYSNGLGELYITSRYIEPIRVKYNAETGLMEVNVITVRERDYDGIDDGINMWDTPVGDLPASHEYNLYNRGWLTPNLTSFYADQTKWPAKNMIQAFGYRRYDDTSTGTDSKYYSATDGYKEFSSDKLLTELFGTVSAPQGSIILHTFDTTQIYQGVADGSIGRLSCGTITVQGTDGDFVVRCDVGEPHGMTTNDYTSISGMSLPFEVKLGVFGIETWNQYKDIEGVVQITSVSTNVFSFPLTLTDNWKVSNIGAYAYSAGYFTTEEPPLQTNEFGEALRTRFRTNSFFLGRVWYGGCDEERIKNRIYYSMVVDAKRKVGECLTNADPTSQNISDPVATDGGYLAISDMDQLQKLVPYGNSMLAFASNGVWQIGPGNLGYFSPVSYSVRRITDIGTVSPDSIVTADRVLYFWAKDGIYSLIEDTNSGYLTTVSISINTINRLYGQIERGALSYVKGVYDDLDKRVLWFYDGLDTSSTELEGSIYFEKIGPTVPSGDAELNTWIYRDVLVLDLRAPGFYRYRFPMSTAGPMVMDVFALPGYLTTERKNKIKMLGRSFSMGVMLEFADDVTYWDYGPSYQPVDAYLITGPDTLQDGARLKTAPFINCYFRKVTGSECLLQPIWDWSINTATGKVGNPMQVYRDVRPNASGNKLIVTKNKLRGRGRSLHLGFHAMPNKPCWLEGWQIDWRVKEKV